MCKLLIFFDAGNGRRLPEKQLLGKQLTNKKQPKEEELEKILKLPFIVGEEIDRKKIGPSSVDKITLQTKKKDGSPLLDCNMDCIKSALSSMEGVKDIRDGKAIYSQVICFDSTIKNRRILLSKILNLPFVSIKGGKGRKEIEQIVERKTRKRTKNGLIEIEIKLEMGNLPVTRCTVKCMKGILGNMKGVRDVRDVSDEYLIDQCLT